MKFAEPAWLLAGLAACALLVWAWRRYDLRQRAALAAFASPHLHEQLVASFSVARRNWQRGLFLGCVALLFVALARPQAGFRWTELKRRGIEILFAVDTSKSMLTPDVKPDRLTRAKLAVDDFVSHLDGDGVGLVAFAGTAFLECPITLDYDAFDESLDALDTNTIPRGGTDISSAIREAQAALQNRPSTDKILVLLTDGEDLEGNAVDTAKAAARDGLKIYTVGVGTPSGDLIPLPPESGGGFVKDASGQYVKSHLDEKMLQSIAQATGGRYEPLGPQGQGLERIYRTALAPLARHDLASRQQRVYIERYQWPLTAALLLLLASLAMGTRRGFNRKPVPQAVPLPTFSRRSPVPQSVTALIAFTLLFSFTHARASISGAESAYQKGDFAAAAQEYATAAQHRSHKDILQFDAGAAAYKAGQYAQATEDFQKSLAGKASADPKQLTIQQDAYYNLGNTLYRTGQKTEKGDVQQTIQNWEKAVKSYDSALQLRATDADAKFNRDFVQRKLDELKKKQQQQQQQQKQNQQNQSQNQNQKQNQNQNQQNQGQSGQSSSDKNVAKKGTSQEQQKQSGQQNQANKSGSQNKNSPSKQEQGQQNQANNSGKQPNQQGQGQQNQQNQQGQQGQQQNQQGRQAQQQNQQNQPGQQGQQNQQNQQANGQQSPQQKEGNSMAQNNTPLDETGHTSDQRVPGQMTKQEARELLDSVRDEQRNLPGTPTVRGGVDNQPDQPLKDW